MMQRCEKFKKRRIQTLAIRTWIHLTKQRMVIADKNHCRMHRLMVLVIGSWHQWADANHQQKIAATHLKKSHNYLLQREVFTAIKEEFQKSKKASHCYQCHLLKKATKCWHRQSSRQVDLKNRACQLISHHKIYTTSRIFFVWKQRFVKRCEDRNNYMELVERKVVVIVRYWRRKAQRTRGEMLKSVLLKRKVRSCFAQWKKHFAALEELQQQLWIFTSWKNRRIQFTILNQWKTALLNNTADRTYQNNWTAKIFNAWKKWSKDSLLRRKNFNNFEAVRQKRQMKASFNYWRTSWRNSQISRKWFCQHLKLRSFEVWWCYVSRENQLRVQLNKLTCSVKRRCLYTSYIRWKDKTVSRTAERTRIQHHADMAKFHFTRRLCLQVFHVWHNEILVSQNIARRQFRLSYKYCQRWKYRVDLISTAIFWNEKQIYKRIWVNWRHTYLREICSMKIVKEFTKQRQIQIFHAWHQLCVCKNRRYDCFPSSILQQLNH
ncbi:protein SFI1 homolog [Octopus bimaculoides]|uniref:Sfi1 spindle body domain-containing protein n=1 Tax=Octopus bimaculoides TaxID=37653 RepID=A0A0L8G7T9_OCTBM|nr:protein SFI1 homolog [Octopus bimaculoides]|eukprot:XP_014783394.1 PREDICTED: protein SFI1 homolog [Octopus bimaculoides]